MPLSRSSRCRRGRSRERGRTRRHRRSSRASGARRCRTHGRSDGASAPARYREIRYEELVTDPEGVVAGICEFAEIPFEPDMLAYADAVDVSEKPHQQRLLRPPTAGVRSWRDDMSSEDVVAFEQRRRRRPPRARLRRHVVGVERRVRRRLGSRTTPASPRGTRRRRCSNARRCGGGAIRGCQRRERGTSRPGVAIRRPLRERKYVRSVAIPGAYLPRGIRHASDPSSTRSATVRFSSVETKT